MLEEGDPLATALLEQYQGIPMPNLRLTDVDVEKLLGYIADESRRIAAVRAAGGGGDRHAHHGHHAHGDAAM